ncbi:hypothetical protein FRAAL1765 [Frankia alni ACN14a]|uniref:Uncharacterized protein n=1 Tax=Frankia alni (strain DSM 45986 / CECT 9034 / ACN14a) TaxID=326424 RepID=Q0RPW2_FRAAA|nr:hypothetical protein FRAAL1765 [Frankia alni ACN14a]
MFPTLLAQSEHLRPPAARRPPPPASTPAYPEGAVTDISLWISGRARRYGVGRVRGAGRARMSGAGRIAAGAWLWGQVVACTTV